MDIIENLLKLHNIDIGKATRVESDNEFEYTFLTGDSITLKLRKVDLSGFSPDDFEIFLAKTKYNLESHSRLLTLSGGRRLGWIFPVSSLQTREEIPDDKWAQIYANFAAHALVHNNSIFEHSKTPNLVSEYVLSDFYPQEMCVVVISKRSLVQYNLDVNCIKLTLLQKGYIPCKRQKVINSLFDIDMDEGESFEEKLKISEVSEHLNEYLLKFEILLSKALVEENPISSFFTLYQIIERMLLIIFEAAIKNCRENDSLLNNPWGLKEELAKISNEKWRLNLLFHNFVKPGLTQSLLYSLQEKCLQFLLKYNLISEQIDSSAETLYKVRNAIVHRQIELPSEANEDLKEINADFFKICFELIEKFNVEVGLHSLSRQPKEITEHFLEN